MKRRPPNADAEASERPTAEAGWLAPVRESPPTVSWREGGAVCGLLLLLLAAAHGDVIFGGRSLVYSDNYNPLDYRVLPQNYGTDPVPAEAWSSRNLLPFANFHDPGATWWQWEPGGEFLRRALRRGEWPWWDPYVGAGAPAMANLTQSFFFPPYLLLVALGNTSLLKNVYFLGLLLLASAATHLLLRRHGLSVQSSLFAAVAVLFCGGLLQNVGSFIGQTAALLPPALWLTRWFLDRPSWRRTAALAGGYACCALASFPPLLVAIFGLSATYAAVLLAACADGRRRASRYALGILLALALVSFCYLPAFAVQGQEAPQVVRTYAKAAETTVRWEAFSQLLSPVLMGGGGVQAAPPMADFGQVHVPYVGIVVLLFAGLAGPLGRPDANRLWVVLVGAGVVIALKLMGVQPVQSIGRLPLLDHVHFAHYFGIPLGLVLCLLAGFGFERLLAGEVGRWRLRWIGGGCAVIALMLPLIARVRGALDHPWASQWWSRWALLAATLAVALGALLALRAGANDGRRRSFAVAGLVALLAFEGIGNTWYPRQRRWDVWRHPVPYAEQLIAHRGQGRVFSGGALPANAASAFELHGLDSLMTFNSPRIFEMYRRYVDPRAYLFLREASVLPPDPVLDAANIGLLALGGNRGVLMAEAEARGYRRFWQDSSTHLFERSTEPRYYFTSQYRILEEARALEALAERRPQREVLMEVAPPFVSSPNRDSDPTVRASVSRNRVVLRLEAPRQGLIYCSETQAPGWRATVNGAAAPIFSANYAFRAVAVPAGDVVVELSYFPPGLRPGLLLGFLALAVVLLLLLRRERGSFAPLSLRSARRERPRARRWWLWAGGLALTLSVGIEAQRGDHFAPLPLFSRGDPLAPRPAAFYRVAWAGVELPPIARAGETVRATIGLRNASGEVWPSFGHGDQPGRPGAGAVRLGWRWLSQDSRTVAADYAGRWDLSSPMGPGESRAVAVTLTFPETPGNYMLQVDLVHELVAWFESRGAARLLVPVTVQAR